MSVLAISIVSLSAVVHGVHGVILDSEPGDEHLNDAAKALGRLNFIYEGHADDPFWYRRSGMDDREKAISEVQTKTGTDAAGIYGELAPASFAEVFEKVGAKPGMKYYDLGAGHGKSVVLAHLMGMDSTGVELASMRWDNSCKALNRLQQDHEMQQSLVQSDNHQKTGMRFLKGSFLEVDFSDADIVFTDSVEFSPSMLEGLAKGAKKMKAGSKVISWQGLPGDGFKKLDDLFEPASWNQQEKFTVQEVLGNADGGAADSLLSANHEYASQAKAGDTVCVL